MEVLLSLIINLAEIVNDIFWTKHKMSLTYTFPGDRKTIAGVIFEYNTGHWNR